MTRSTSIKTRFVLWVTLLAFCAGGGCAACTYRNSEPGPYTISWKRKMVSCDPPFGYRPTYWYPWPQGCALGAPEFRRAAGNADLNDSSGAQNHEPTLRDASGAEVIPAPAEYQPAPNQGTHLPQTGLTPTNAEQSSAAELPLAHEANAVLLTSWTTPASESVTESPVAPAAQQDRLVDLLETARQTGSSSPTD